MVHGIINVALSGKGVWGAQNLPSKSSRRCSRSARTLRYHIFDKLLFEDNPHLGELRTALNTATAAATTTQANDWYTKTAKMKRVERV